MPYSLHRGTQSGCCGGRMYYPKADYSEKFKAITSN